MKLSSLKLNLTIRCGLLMALSVILMPRVSGQTQKDTLFAVYSPTPVVIDGSGEESCWERTDWHPIDQVWIPYNAKMAPGDFAGKYKVAWDSLYLYLLVEIIDDMLSDDHPDPLNNYWEDDCLEVFIDEDRSMGYHLNNNNAFAYHISLSYDVIDATAYGAVNLKNNVVACMDTIAPNTYLWEVAVKIYNDKFNLSNPEASRVILTAGKLMGFALAYCDNDETTRRENFIGSIYMTQATANDNYKTADYFQPLVLSAKEILSHSLSGYPDAEKKVTIYPNPAREKIRIRPTGKDQQDFRCEIRSLNGSLLISEECTLPENEISITDLPPGIYMVSLFSDHFFVTEKLILL
ncbi:MAG: sugar-binding protein [Prolixibacteraceae bacterium]|jgi:hypothetical protein|nr:T9SS type A sorting domain-containing protein [Prolixibacteraceae bacterium]MDI9564062.1 sugar-binding protein [Bacteroidota bacterium]OQB79380.1 MAG: hypothetical protein BWX87_02190 [Bacteroidetes bacterium ADurb.Bin123]HNU77903.1 sugar-binding protein [Prolixibacteraceae bacterium]HNZ69873.1 sugar-binding protein [Prolixibacteraceae bacterium]